MEMDLSMKVHGNKGVDMGKADINLLMVMFMLENGLMIEWMAVVSQLFQLEKLLKQLGKEALSMEMDTLLIGREEDREQCSLKIQKFYRISKTQIAMINFL